MAGGGQRTCAGLSIALRGGRAVRIEPRLRNGDGCLHRGRKGAQGILSPRVALALGDAGAGVVGRLPLALALGHAHIVARLARKVPEPAAIALLERVARVPPPRLPYLNRLSLYVMNMKIETRDV